MISPLLALSNQACVVDVVKVWPWTAAIVKLPLIVKAFWIVSVVVAKSSPPVIVNPPVPSALALPAASTPEERVVPPL